MLKPWIELFRALGGALFELFRAEAAALKAELEKNGRTLAYALALFAAAAMAGFWLVALVLYTLIQVLEIWLPPWGAALVLTGAVLLVIAGLALVGMRYFKRLESPSASVQRRWQDHSRWWSQQLLAAADEEAPPRRSRRGRRRTAEADADAADTAEPAAEAGGAADEETP